MILKYFNAVNVVQEEKERWSMNDDYDIGKKNSKKEKIYTEERLRMIEEEENASHRGCLIKYANERARRGAEKIRLREEKAAAAKV